MIHFNTQKALIKFEIATCKNNLVSADHSSISFLLFIIYAIHIAY